MTGLLNLKSSDNTRHSFLFISLVVYLEDFFFFSGNRCFLSKTSFYGEVLSSQIEETQKLNDHCTLSLS